MYSPPHPPRHLVGRLPPRLHPITAVATPTTLSRVHPRYRPLPPRRRLRASPATRYTYIYHHRIAAAAAAAEDPGTRDRGPAKVVKRYSRIRPRARLGVYT